MKKTTLLLILCTGCLSHLYAQSDATASLSNKNSDVDQYIGVQMNDLIRQVFNFNSTGTSTTTVTNPYLLTYNINSKSTGWGLRAGFGYNYSYTSTNDGITAATTTLNDLSLRLGIEKQFWSTTRWSAGAGLDFVYSSNNDKTSTNVSAAGDTSITATKDVVTSYGGGPMAWLRFKVSEHVLIGTEASFYYTVSKEKNTLDVTASPGTDPTTGQPLPPVTTETTTSPTVTNAVFSNPVVFYLIVKF